MQAIFIHRSAVLGALFFGSVAGAADWNGGSGGWTTAANWSTGDVPDTASESAVVRAGSVTLDTTYSLNNFTFGGGTLTGAGGLNLTSFDWSGGTFSSASGGPTISVAGTATLKSSATSYLYLNGYTLNLGNANQSGTDGTGVYLGNGARLNLTGAYHITDNSIIYADTTSTVDVTGTLVKTGGAGTNFVSSVITEAGGLVEADAGTLQVGPKNGQTQAGRFAAGSGAVLQISNGGTSGTNGSATLKAGTLPTFSGQGTVQLTLGLYLASGTVQSDIANFTLAGATIARTWNLANLTFTRGAIGSVNVTPTTVTVTGNTSIVLEPAIYTSVTNATLNLQGNTTQTGANQTALTLTTGMVNNSGTYSIADNSGLNVTDAAASRFYNTGTLAKTGGTGASIVQGIVNGTGGTVSARSGRLVAYVSDLQASTGVFNAADGATLQLFAQTPVTLTSVNGLTSFTGDGAIQLAYGTFNASNTVKSAAPKFTLAGAALRGNWQIGNLTWTAGGFYGNGSGGTANSGTLVGTSTFVASLNGNLTVSGYNLALQGDTTQTNTSGFGLSLGANSSVTNNASYLIAGDSNILSTALSGTFNNAGTLIKSGGTGTSTVMNLVAGQGSTISGRSGTMQLLLSGPTIANGTFDTQPGGTIVLSSTGTTGSTLTLGANTRLTGGGTFRNSDRVIVSQGNLTPGGMTFDVADVTSSTAPDFTISGGIGDAAATGAGFSKLGAGTMLLTGSNSFGGTVTIAAGVLRETPAAYAMYTTGGGVDLTGATARLVLDYTGSTSPAALVRGYLASGRFQASTATGNQTLGYSDAGSAVTLLPTLRGDADLDGDVDFNDFLVLQNNFGNSGTTFVTGDFNYDGVTNFNDFLALQNSFGQSYAGAAVATSAAQVAAMSAFASATAVPEPGMVAGVGLAVVGLMWRRRAAVLV